MSRRLPGGCRCRFTGKPRTTPTETTSNPSSVARLGEMTISNRVRTEGRMWWTLKFVNHVSVKLFFFHWEMDKVIVSVRVDGWMDG